MPHEWTHRELADYIQYFDEGQKEATLKALTEYELLQSFLGTTEGRLILDNVVEQIRDFTMKIVKLSVEGAKKNSDDIAQMALNIRVAYNFMVKIATMAARGDDIIRQIKVKG